MTPPIIIIHRGDSPYLSYTIAQAKESNPNSRIILLGDRSNSFYLGVEHHFYQDYFAEAGDFSSLFRYEYFPNYQYTWILFCHQKYFALRDFCRKHDLKSFLLIDSDVMIYENIKCYFDYYSKGMMTLSSTGKGISAQAAISIINNTNILEKLCAIYVRMFSKPVEALKKEYGAELFTEMVGLYTLMREESDAIINTYNKTKDEFIINHSMETDARFEYQGNLLRIIWKKNIPYLQEKSTGSNVKAPFLHFHGKGKYEMKKYLRIENNKNRYQMICNRSASGLLKYPRRFANKLFKRSIYPGI
jgi:hypothetical protein